jgi:hypothetical protein
MLRFKLSSGITDLADGAIASDYALRKRWLAKLSSEGREEAHTFNDCVGGAEAMMGEYQVSRIDS